MGSGGGEKDREKEFEERWLELGEHLEGNVET